MSMLKAKENLRVQKWIFALSVILFVIKLVAWVLTASAAIFSDAMESIVNVIAGFIGLVSLYIAAKPKDENHPYGHGKAEFLSAAAEGTLITVAGLIIIYESVKDFYSEKPIEKLDYGLILTFLTAIINFVAGYYCIKQGKKNNSLALQASGKHLQTDTYSTIGVVIGLIIILITRQYILDKIIALAMGVFIIYNGIKLIRAAFSGIMDEADENLLQRIVKTLNTNRTENWIDIHNLRVVKYGATMHIDCHFTLPWYFNLREAHSELNKLTKLLENEFGDSIEFFVHTDDCREKNCSICLKENCKVRLHPFERKIEWTVHNIANNARHSLTEK